MFSLSSVINVSKIHQNEVWMLAKRINSWSIRISSSYRYFPGFLRSQYSFQQDTHWVFGIPHRFSFLVENSFQLFLSKLPSNSHKSSRFNNFVRRWWYAKCLSIFSLSQCKFWSICLLESSSTQLYQLFRYIETNRWTMPLSVISYPTEIHTMLNESSRQRCHPTNMESIEHELMYNRTDFTTRTMFFCTYYHIVITQSSLFEKDELWFIGFFISRLLHASP
jgi:hypothetical protein